MPNAVATLACERMPTWPSWLISMQLDSLTRNRQRLIIFGICRVATLFQCFPDNARLQVMQKYMLQVVMRSVCNLDIAQCDFVPDLCDKVVRQLSTV